MAILQAVIALAIGMAAGPEIILAMEMTTLLEMLGASLFLTAYAAAVKLKAIELYRALHGVVLPVAQVAVMRSSAPVFWKAAALMFVVANVLWCLMYVLVVGAYGHHLLNLVI
jgi:hypothetical protein